MKKVKSFLLIFSCIVTSLLLLNSCNPDDTETPVLEKGDPVIEISYDNVTKTSATLYAKVFPYGNEVTVTIQYAEKNSQNWSSFAFEEKISGYDWVVKDMMIISLKPGTTYKFRALANKITSKETYFNTLPDL